MFTICPLERLYGAVCGAVSDKVLIGDKTEGISFRLLIEGSVLLIGWSDFQKAGIALAGEKILGGADGQVGEGRGQVFTAEIIRAEDHILVLAVCFPGRINDNGIWGVGQCAAKRAGIIIQIIGSIGDMIKVGIVGESTDDVAVSTSKLRDQIKALTNVDGKGGFDILTKSGDFKSTYEIMEGIANVWKEMNDVDKASLLEQVAGKNRANVVSGMLDNWKDAQNAAKTAAESAGSATKENETYLDSINGKISQFTAAFEKLSKDVLDSDLIKFFIELATHIANLADEAVKLVDNFGLIPTALTGISTGLVTSLIKNKGTSGKLYARLHKGNSCVGCRCQIIKYPNCWERLRAA